MNGEATIGNVSALPTILLQPQLIRGYYVRFPSGCPNGSFSSYAPAYERYGADIKAIHFIGPSKPWSSIPWRAAIGHPSAESMRSYAYGALVDRWFAVYDRHYRPPIPMTEAEYQAKRYESAWDTATFEPTAILELHPTATVSVVAGYDLSQLRQVAIEGTDPVAASEGEYRSMPLEGRVSLMRPEKSQVQAYDPAKDSPDAYQGDQSQSQQETVEEEPRPPGREGLPSYLYRPPARKSEPQSPSNWPPAPRNHESRQHQDPRHQPHHQFNGQPSHPHPHPHSYFQLPQDNILSSADQKQPPDPMLLYVPAPYPELQSNEPPTPENQQQQRGSQHHHHHQEEYRSPSPPLITWNPAQEPPPHDPPPSTAWDVSKQHYSNVWDMPVSRQYRAPYHLYSPTYAEPRQRSPQTHYAPTHGSPSSWYWDGHGRHSQRKESEYGQQEPLKQQEHKQQDTPEILGVSSSFAQSPRMVWQHPLYHHHDHHKQQQQQFPHIEHQSQEYEQPQSHGYHVHSFYDEPRPDGFFHAPPPASIPNRLLKEGHYDNVMADNPHPDYKKVRPVFPWETPQRPRSSRVFPDWDPKPPALATPPRPPPVSLPLVGAPFPESRDLFAPAVAASYSLYGAFKMSHPERTPSPPPPSHVQRKFNPPPEPPRGYAGQYANAWDEDPVIQNYAHVLSGGKSKHLGQPSPAPWPSHQGQIDYLNSPSGSRQRVKGRAIARPRSRDEEDWTNWAERAEASSRDGDDEEDEDEYIEEVQSPQTGLWKKEKRKRNKSKGSAYRSIGVQTDAIETKEIGVQVSMPPIMTPTTASDAASRYASARVSRGAGGMEYGREGGLIGWAVENLSPMQAEAYARVQRIGTGAMSPRLHDPMAYSPLQRSPTRSPTGTPFRPGSPPMGNINIFKSNGLTIQASTRVQPPSVRPRVSSGDTVTTAADSTVIASPATDPTVDFPEFVEQEELLKRGSFPRSAIRGQQPSPVTARLQTPYGIAPVRRRAGRVFDPARGVEIIKKTNEEVLTRFLKQEPTSWGEKDQKQQGPPTPSATP